MSRKRKIIYWLLAGCFISLAIAAMLQTRNGSMGQFYQDGYRDDWTMVWTAEATGCGKYDAARGVTVLESGGGICSILKEKLDESANFLELEITDLKETGSLWSVDFLDENMNLLEHQEYQMDSGKYCIEIEDRDYEYFKLSLMDDRNIEISVNSIQLLEYRENTDFLDILPIWGVCYAVYCLLFFVLFKAAKRKQIRPWNAAAVLERHADYILDGISERKQGKGCSGKVRVFLFAWLVIGWRIANEHGVNKYYGFIVLYTLILFWALIYSTPIEKAEKMRNNSLVNIWLLVYALQFLSDIVTKKNYSFSEVWMLLCFGMLFRAWSRMAEPEKLLQDFSNAVLILNAVNILYYYFGNGAKYFDGRPTGTWSNPNPFSIGMVLCQAVMLFLLYQAWVRRKKWWSYVLPGAEFVLGMWMIYTAQCRTAWLAMAAMMAWFLLYLLAGKLHVEKKLGIGLALGVVFAVAAVVLWLVLRSGTAFSQREIDYSSASGLTSGRTWIWKKYIANMNLFGHEKYLVIGGKSWFAHNGIVKNFYKFGLLAGIAHLILLIECVYAALCYWKNNKKNEYTVLIMGIGIAYLIPSMMESIDELPMVWIGWFAFYFIIGYLMQTGGARKRENEECKSIS